MINREDIETLCPGCFREKNGGLACPYCKYDEGRHVRFALPLRTILSDKYVVGRLLGNRGGYGITYLALDHTLDTKVAIKEFFPQEVATREADRTTVTIIARKHEELFQYGLERFLAEARTLAKIKHPNIVGVHNFFKANGTAYLVMSYYEGQTLSEFLRSEGGRLTPETAIEIMLPVLGGLQEVHQWGYLHRDIKPQNIYLIKNGQPILLDFGAARLYVQTHITVMVTDGFTPPEQYSSRGNQGPWTDIYTAAATLYYLITGQVPSQAQERVMEDTLIPPHQIDPDLSPQLSLVLMHGLALIPEERPQSVEDFQEMLMEAMAQPQPQPPPPVVRDLMQAVPGSDVKIRLLLTPEEVSDGVTKLIDLEKLVSCEACDGRGRVARTEREEREPCSACRGEGRMLARKPVRIDVPPGQSYGSHLVLLAEGDAGERGGPAGKLYVGIDAKEKSADTGQADPADLASRGARLVAFLLDILGLLVIGGLGIVLQDVATSEAALFVVIVGGVGYGAVQCMLLSIKGQSLGKILADVRIVKVDSGENGGFVTNVVLRVLATGMIQLTVIGLLMDILFIFREDRRCVHDFIAETQVIWAS